QAREDLCESGSTGTVEFAEHVLLERVLDRHKEAVCERGLDRPASRSAPSTVINQDLIVPEVCG
ncbi:MAG: hypothetical protein ACI9VR_003721, partial [Cognaticolwellia sp.]